MTASRGGPSDEAERTRRVRDIQRAVRCGQYQLDADKTAEALVRRAPEGREDER